MALAFDASRSELLKTFSASNPWDADQRGTFEIYRHVMGGLMPLHAAADERSRIQSYWLRSQADGASRPLPDALAALWLADKVPTERLPQLLKGLEPQLGRSDFLTHQALNPIQRAIRRWAPFVFALFVIALGVSSIGSDPGTGWTMIAVGVVVAAGSWLFGRRFSSRRRRQEEWIMAQLRS
jgi:hypothetical protein